MRLKGRTAFVTGAAQGIGRSVAIAFLREGARVVAADRNPGPLAALAALGAVPLSLDVTDEAAVAAAAEAHPDVRVLVNCVGIVAAGTLGDCSAEALRRSFEINVVSMFHTCRAFLPGMVEARDGSIVNIASVVSSTRAAPNRFAYGATKAAVIGLTKSVARDYAAYGIRCNAISPGTVDTPSLEERIAAQGGDTDEVRARFVARQPLGRLGEADEIAAAAVLLASDEARFMTGSDLVIDGGMSL